MATLINEQYSVENYSCTFFRLRAVDCVFSYNLYGNSTRHVSINGVNLCGRKYKSEKVLELTEPTCKREQVCKKCLAKCETIEEK